MEYNDKYKKFDKDISIITKEISALMIEDNLILKEFNPKKKSHMTIYCIADIMRLCNHKDIRIDASLIRYEYVKWKLRGRFPIMSRIHNQEVPTVQDFINHLGHDLGITEEELTEIYDEYYKL